MNRTTTPATALAAAALAFAACAAQADPLRKDHPLIGEWQVAVPGTTCHEIYRIRPDGSSLVTSAEEVSESALQISYQPSDKGFYKWVDRIVKDNGKKDCLGEVTKPGQESTNFILLHHSGRMFLMCEKEDLERCIGPFVKLTGTEV
jgi:hypothetical protein